MDDRRDYTACLDEITTRGMQALVMYLAKDTGVLEELIQDEAPKSAAEVAQKRNLKERYVKELLNVLVSAGLVITHTTDEPTRYFMSPVAKRVMSKYTTLPLLSRYIKRLDQLRTCFNISGPYGFPYCSEDGGYADIEPTLNRYHMRAYIDITENGIPQVKRVLEKGVKVLECGSAGGDFTSYLTRRFPRSYFTASEYNKSMMHYLENSLAKKSENNIKTKEIDLMKEIDQNLVSKFDVIFANCVIHDLPFPVEGLKRIKTLLKPDGYFVMSEIQSFSDVKNNPVDLYRSVLYTISLFLSVPQSSVSENSTSFGVLMGQENISKCLTAAGFKVLKTSKCDSDTILAYYACQNSVHSNL